LNKWVMMNISSEFFKWEVSGGKGRKLGPRANPSTTKR
jgi:hypothetical protein